MLLCYLEQWVMQTYKIIYANRIIETKVSLLRQFSSVGLPETTFLLSGNLSFAFAEKKNVWKLFVQKRKMNSKISRIWLSLWNILQKSLLMVSVG